MISENCCPWMVLKNLQTVRSIHHMGWSDAGLQFQMEQWIWSWLNKKYDIILFIIKYLLVLWGMRWTQIKTSSANDREDKGKKWWGPTHVNCENNQSTEHTIWQLDWECSSMELVLQIGYEIKCPFLRPELLRSVY